jgi:hypothetical protein
MNDEAPKGPQRAPRKSSWLFTVACCGYFLLGGWAADKIVPICLTLFAGLGFSVSSGSLLFHLLLNYVWLIVAGVAILVILALTKQARNFSERYRRPVNLVLLIAAIGFAPMLLVEFALKLSGPFHLIGKLAQ